MKQYDKIWVPEKINHPTGQMHFVDRDGDTPVLKKENAIVLTIEELREVWAMAKSGPDYPGVFELFLKSKGIQLP